MGLDITAYRQLKKIDCVFDEDGEPIDPTTREPLEECYLRAWVNPDFPGRADDIEDKGVYLSEDSFGFRAGSYGGYNHWRRTLAELAGYPAAPFTRFGTTEMRHDAGAWAADSGPFWELINFSDCEGVIGATASAKLAADFAAHQDKADAHADERFRAKYAEFRQAFEMAADGGAVEFH